MGKGRTRRGRRGSGRFGRPNREVKTSSIQTGRVAGGTTAMAAWVHKRSKRAVRRDRRRKRNALERLVAFLTRGR